MKMAQFKNIVLVAIAVCLTASIHIGEAHAAPKEQEDAELAVSRVQRAGFKCEGKYDFYNRGLFDSIVCSGKQYNIRVEGNDLVVWSEPALFSSSVTKTIPLENDLREKRDHENSEKFAALKDYDTKQRKEASNIIPFEQSATASLPAWDNRIE